MKAAGMETFEHLAHRVGRARDQQAAAGLRIRQDRLLDGAVAGQIDEACTPLPVSRGASRDIPCRDQRSSVGQQRDGVPAHRRADAGAAAHFQQMAQQSETRDVGHCVHAGESRQLNARGVELGGAGDQLAVLRVGDLLLLDRGTVDTHAERLAQDDLVTGSGVGIAPDMPWIDQTDDHQAVDRFE